MGKARKAGLKTASSKSGALGFEELRQEEGKWILHGKPASAQQSDDLVPAVDKAVRALALINASGKDLSLATIADETQITKSHCYSILRTLVHHGWLSFDANRKTYSLNAGILRDLSQILHGSTPVSLIRPMIDKFSVRTGVSCILSEPLDRIGFVVVAKASARGQLEISYPIGHHFPRDASAQMKAYLAWSDEKAIEHWFLGWRPTRYSASTPTTLDEIRKELLATRLRGYSRSIGEFTDGLTALALPIFNSAGKVAYILNSMGISTAMAPIERQVAEQMITTISEIHELIGSNAPASFPTAQPSMS